MLTPTCAPRGEAWASAACPESTRIRAVVAAADGEIVGVTNGIEPQAGSAFLVALDGFRFSFGVISAIDMRKLGAYFSMGEFGAGMGSAGVVSGIDVAGDRSWGHWSWVTRGWTYEVYPLRHQESAQLHVPRWVVAHLIEASVSEAA